MHHIPVPNLNVAAGRLIAGVLNLSTDHPIELCLILALVAGAAASVLLDVVTDRP